MNTSPRPSSDRHDLDWMNQQPYRAAAEAVALGSMLAGEVFQQLHADGRAIDQLTKPDESPVTAIDFAVQAVVTLHLQRTLDEHVQIMGEEDVRALEVDSAATLRDSICRMVRTVCPDADDQQIVEAINACDASGGSGAFWALDPIDGTKGFLRGGQFCTALALIENGGIVLGVLGCPNLPADNSLAEIGDDDETGTEIEPAGLANAAGSLLLAGRGRGAWQLPIHEPQRLFDQQPQRIWVRDYDPQRSLLMCESVEVSQRRQAAASEVIAMVHQNFRRVHIDSQCKYAVIARGGADGYLRPPLRDPDRDWIWDHAPGKVIAEEAGAQVTDMFGNELDFTQGTRLEVNRGVIAAHPKLHQQLVEAARQSELMMQFVEHTSPTSTT